MDLRLLLGTLALHFSTSACARTAEPQGPAAATDLRFVGGELERQAPRIQREQEAPPDTRSECRDQPMTELAGISCDGEHIVVKFPIRVYPNERKPGDLTPKVIAAVAELLRQHPEILLVRVEVRSARRPSTDPAARRFERLEAQARADVVLKELWRRHGISAERLEAVGHGPSGRIPGVPSNTNVVSFVIAQRAQR
jgi:hypothetical protein